MHEVCMSTNRRIEPDLNQDVMGWTGEPPICLGPESLVYQEEPSDNIGGLLIKSGLVVLFSITVYGGYQFLKDSSTDQQLAKSEPLYEWSAPPIKTDTAKKLAVVDNQKPEVRKIDLTKTGSVKKVQKPIGKPIPTTPDVSIDAKFHIVQPGDTLSAISRKFQVSTAKIIEINLIKNPGLIKPGMKLYVTR